MRMCACGVLSETRCDHCTCMGTEMYARVWGHGISRNVQTSRGFQHQSHSTSVSLRMKHPGVSREGRGVHLSIVILYDVFIKQICLYHVYVEYTSIYATVICFV